MGSKVAQALRTFTHKDTLLGCSYVIALSASHLLENYLNHLPFDWWIITIIALLFAIKGISQNKNNNHTIDEIILMFSIYFILSRVVRAVIINFFILPYLPQFYHSQILQIIIISAEICFKLLLTFVLTKINLNRLFIFIIYRLALKMIIFIVSFLLLLASIYVTFNYFTNLALALAPQIILILITTSGLVQILKDAHNYEMDISPRFNDMKKNLTLLNLRAEDIQTADELKEMINATIELLAIETAKATSQRKDDEPEDFEAFITAAIESLKLNNDSDVEIITNIQYFEPHKKINAMNVSYMLGTLLENAIQAGTQLPILVDILSTENFLIIKTSNDTQLKTQQELDNMLTKGYSTKGKVGRGFGLSKLKQLVESHQGNISISQEINVASQTNYIVFMLTF